MKKNFLSRLIIASALALTLVFSIFTSNYAKPLLNAETMRLANILYENGRYSEASQTYQQLIEQGYIDSALFYNLGNAYYRQDNLSKAILNYERAAYLSPRDENIQANLAYARGQRLDQYDTKANSPLEQWTQTISTKMTLNEMSIVALVSFWALAVFFILYNHIHKPHLKKALRYILTFTLLIFTLSVFTLGNRIYIEKTYPTAVVTASSIDVVSNPGEDGISQFTLHSGAKVILLETRGQWAHLSLPGDQFQGWVPINTLEKVGL